MRRGIQADLVPGGEQNGFEHRAGRALAVGPGDGQQDGRGGFSQGVAHLRHSLQSELDGLRMDALDVFEPIGEAPAGHEAKDPDQTGEGACRCRRVSRLASLSRIWRRSTIMSTAPFSSRNSARWKPSGSFSRTVCSMTRGPAKPMRARGSAMTTSPIMAKLAETPPMVGSVSTEMNGSLCAASCVSAAVVLAICMRENKPS